MKDLTEQIYDELNAQVIRMLEHARKQAERIAELERENSSLAYELNVALSGGSVSIPSADTDKLREAILEIHVILPSGYDEREVSAFKAGAKATSDAALKVLASTALQAPVREVPEGWQLVPIVSTSKMDRAGEDAYESRGHCDCGNAHGVSMEMVYDAMLAVAPLPAAPVQEPKP